MTPITHKPTKQSVRLTLDMTPEMKVVLDDLARRDGSTIAALLRKAVALLKAVKDAELEGEVPALMDKNGNVTARLIGI